MGATRPAVADVASDKSLGATVGTYDALVDFAVPRVRVVLFNLVRQVLWKLLLQRFSRLASSTRHPRNAC